MDKTISLIGKYIKNHINDNREMPIGTLKSYALLGRDKIEGEKVKHYKAEMAKIIRDYEERDRVNKIHHGQNDFLDRIIKEQRALDEKNERISTKASEISGKIEEARGDLGSKLDAVAEKTLSRLEVELQSIRSGEREMAEKFMSAISGVDGKLPAFGEHFSDISSRIERVASDLKDTIVRATEKDVEPETQQVIIEETGQVIEICKRK